MPACLAAGIRACGRLSSSRVVSGRSKAASIQIPKLWPSIRRYYASVSASELQFGQPLHETHPHLLRPGELTRGITALEYAERRTKLAKALPDGAVAVLAAADVKFRSGPVFYQFQQDANFFYLTGFDEPEALAVISKSPDGSDHVFHLFVRPKDPKVELWEGARSGLQAAMDVFNADETGDVKDVKRLLSTVLGGAKEVYTDIPTKPSNTDSVSFFSRFFGRGTASSTDSFAGLVADQKVKPLKTLLNNLRVLKSPAEIANMRLAGQASGRAITSAMKKQWSTEKDLASYLAYEFKNRGCDEEAYIPVVAGGQNALGIHYTSNNAVLSPEDLVLVDAGGQVGHYVADITRTWPLSKRFSQAQKDLYNAVLAVQRTCVSMCRENAAVSLDRLHEVAESGLRSNLQDIGFDLSGKPMNALFPHHIGHYIGLDLHDVPGYPRGERLKVGHVVAVEPGVYVPDDDRWPKHFRGMGIRVEDSVAVQDESPLNLTVEAVKEVDDIEAILGDREGAGQVKVHGPLYNS